MRLPDHYSLTIEHQPHRLHYQTIDEYLESRSLGQIDAAEIVGEIGEDLWECVWYPDGDVMHHVVLAPSLPELLEALGKYGHKEEKV